MSTEAPAGFVNAGREPPVRPGRPDPVVGLRWAVRVGVVLVLFTPLIVTTELVFPFVVGKALYARAVIEILFAFWIALVVRDGEQKPPVSRVLLAFGAWLLASSGAGLLGVSPTRSLWSTYERMQGVFDLAHWLAFAIVAASVFRSLRDWRVLLGVNVAVSGLVCGLGVAQHLTTRGVVGLLAYLGLWSAMAGVTLRAFQRNSGVAQLFIGTMGATLVAHFVHNLSLFDTPATMTQFSLLAAFVASEEYRQRLPRHDAGAGPPRERAWLRTARERLSSAVSSSPGAVAATVAVAGLTTASLALCIAPARRAAAATAQGMGADLAWPDRIEHFQRAIAEFPGLANYTRMQLIDHSSRESARASAGEFDRIVDLVTAAGASGLEVEPENWMLEFHLARFFQIAATRDVDHLRTARRHTDRLVDLAPRTWEATDVRTEQERLERLLFFR